MARPVLIFFWTSEYFHTVTTALKYKRHLYVRLRFCFGLISGDGLIMACLTKSQLVERFIRFSYRITF